MENKKANNTTSSENQSTKFSINKLGRKSYKIFNAVLIIFGIVIFALVNIFASVLVDRNPRLAKDWTKGNYGLNKVTKEYFEYMDHDITIKVLMDEERLVAVETDYGFGYQVNQLLKEMSAYSNVTLEYENIITTPVRVLNEKYPDIDWGSADNLFLITDNETGKYKIVNKNYVFPYTTDETGETYIYGQAVEASVLTAIQHVTSNKVVKVGLSVGNGELFNAESKNFGACAYIPVFLDDNAYEAEEINLLTDSPSEDTEVIIMMAPDTDLTAEAVDALSLWLRNDGDFGRTLFYVPNDQAKDTPNLDLFLEQWGMKLSEGYISEDMGNTVALGNTRSDRFALMEYYDDTYTLDIRTDLKVLMPDCTPVEITDENIASPLLVTSDKATTVVASDENTMDGTKLPSTGKALNGAAIGVKSNDEDKKSAVIVWGSVYALKDTITATDVAGNYNNMTYFINLLNNFSAKGGDRILVESTRFESTSIIVKSSQQVTVGILFMFVVPVALVAVGIVVWVRRRHR
ncbi:MAG: hypothetical protein E7566_02120 [Ruminococcaceae bacterium]|nr:hypothetical protein [Oscillospiraceae bacterium]